MSCHRSEPGVMAILVTAALGLGVWGCTSDQNPTEAPVTENALSATSAFGPFPVGTTIFVDVDNRSGVENGSRDHPFNTVSEALRAAENGDAVGLAPGVYAESFASLTPNYVISGLKDFKLLGSGVENTTIRGDHSFSLIRVQNGASALIKNLTIEGGGHIRHSEGGGIQVLGLSGAVNLTLQNVHLQNNEAVNGAAIAADGNATLKLINVLVANNRSENCCAVFLQGVNGSVWASFKNVTVTENLASFHAGGIVVDNAASLDLVNSIVWRNSLAQVAKGNSGRERLAVSYSDVGGRVFPGPGNISVFPQFIDPATRNYRLRHTSPAIDAGTNTGAPAADIVRAPRPADGNGDGTAVTDMGAYESVRTTSSSPGVVATVPLSGRPYGVDVSDAGIIYVAKIGTSSLARGNLSTRTFPSTVVVGSTPPHVVFNPAGTKAYATLQTGQGLAVVDVASNTLTRTVPLSSDGFNLIVSPDGARVYVTTADGTLYVINAATNTIITTLAVGAAANGLAWSPSGSVLYVSSRDAGTVVAINPVTNSITRTYTVGGMPQRLAVAPDGSELYVANEVSGLNVVNVASGAVSRMSFGTAAYGLGLSPDGNRLYVLLPQAGEVRILNRTTRTLVKRLSIGGTPRNVAFASDGTALVTNEQAVVFIK
jgi:YVTN family beta-propeller protein